MALIWMNSYDHMEGVVSDDILKKDTSANSSGWGIVTGFGRCSSNCLHTEINGSITKGLTNTGTANKGFAGFALDTTVNLLGSPVFATLAVNNVQWSLYLNVDGSLSVLTGAGGAVQATTAPDVVRQNGWYFVEAGWTAHASTGAMILRVNNVQVMNATGLNTTGGAAQAWTAIRFPSSGNNANNFDDVYVCDDTDDGKLPATNTFLGDSRVEYLRPGANGAHTDWTVIGGGTHANAVDKGAASNLTTPYIQSQTVGNVDTNVYTDPSVSTGTAFGVQVNILAAKDASGPRTIAPVVRIAGVDYVSSTTFSPSQTSSLYFSVLYQTSPATGNRWTLAEVAGAEFGVKVIS